MKYFFWKSGIIQYFIFRGSLILPDVITKSNLYGKVYLGTFYSIGLTSRNNFAALLIFSMGLVTGSRLFILVLLSVNETLSRVVELSWCRIVAIFFVGSFQIHEMLLKKSA